MMHHLPKLDQDRNEDFQVVAGQADHQAPIQLCDSHFDELLRGLRAANLPLAVETGSAHLRAFFALTKIATGALGTEEVVKFQCPVCALQQFDYISEIVKAVKGVSNGR